MATVALNAAETQITVDASFTGLTGSPTAAHIHGAAPRGVNAAVIFPLTLVPVGATSGTVSNEVFAVSPAQAADFKAGLWYVNVHTTQYPGGEIRGQLDAATPVPAMSPWGLIALGTMLAVVGLFGLSLVGRRYLASC